MLEHAIRLRGGWEWHNPAGVTPPQRVSLPFDRWSLGAGKARLVRHFQRPPIEAGRETLWLRLDDVPGLISVALNGHPLNAGPLSENAGPWPLEGLEARNRLELEVDPAGISPEGRSAPWGHVSLVIRTAVGGPDARVPGGEPLGGSNAEI